MAIRIPLPANWSNDVDLGQLLQQLRGTFPTLISLQVSDALIGEFSSQEPTPGDFQAAIPAMRPRRPKHPVVDILDQVLASTGPVTPSQIRAVFQALRNERGNG